MGKTKKNRNAKQGIDTMGVSTSEIAKKLANLKLQCLFTNRMMMMIRTGKQCFGKLQKCQKTV